MAGDYSLDLGDEKKLADIGRSRGKSLDTSPIDMKKQKPATDGQLGNVISTLAGGGSYASKGAALGSLFSPVGSVVGGGVGLLADIFGSIGDSQDRAAAESQQAMTNLRASLSDWYGLE